MENDLQYLRRRMEELDSSELRIQFFRPDEGVRVYHMVRCTIMDLARDAGALYKVGRAVLIDKKVFEDYLERFRVKED